MIKLNQVESKIIDRLIQDTSRKNIKSFNISHYAKVFDINPALFEKTINYLEEIYLLKKHGEAYTWGDNKPFLRKEKQSYYLHL
ncbi:MAG: hypothetical protein KJ697_02915 [Nanoarchaeota archaeon]|nr:hypothetical protein [Nanoarchaeota archaeon]